MSYDPWDEDPTPIYTPLTNSQESYARLTNLLLGSHPRYDEWMIATSDIVYFEIDEEDLTEILYSIGHEDAEAYFGTRYAYADPDDFYRSWVQYPFWALGTYLYNDSTKRFIFVPESEYRK
jgi:hypothetical protein